MPLRQRLENDDRLIRPRHHRFGDSDELALLIEDAEARRLRPPAVKLRRGTGRKLEAAGLDVRQRNVKARAVAHPPLDDRQNIDAGEVRQEALERDKAIAEASRAGCFGELFEPDSLLERKFAHGGTHNFRQMRAAAELFPHFMGERADVGAGGAFDREPREAGFHAHKLVFKDFDRSEEHTSELQSLAYLVCRLLLEKKKQTLLT